MAVAAHDQIGAGSAVVGSGSRLVTLAVIGASSDNALDRSLANVLAQQIVATKMMTCMPLTKTDMIERPVFGNVGRHCRSHFRIYGMLSVQDLKWSLRSKEL